MKRGREVILILAAAFFGVGESVPARLRSMWKGRNPIELALHPASRRAGTRWPTFVLGIALALGLCGCEAEAAPGGQQLLSFEEPAMGTLFTIRIYADETRTAEAETAATRAFARIRELEAIFSDWDGDSEVLKFCHQPAGTRVKLSAELHEILTSAQKLAVATDGAFDPTIGPLAHLWRLSQRDQTLPRESQLQRAFATVGYDKLTLNTDGTAVLAVDLMRINLGGIAKGYAADDALKLLREAGFPRAALAASGDIAVGDPPPGEIGWRIGLTSIQSPDDPDCHIRLANAAVSTSGDTQQFIEIGGQRYSHIVDPKTGLGLTERRSVSVVAPDATTSDSLATALSVIGLDGAARVLSQYPGTSARIRRLTDEQRVGDFPETVE